MLRSGQADAAGELWRRYYARLVSLARKKLRDAPRRTSDEEDVVVEAFDSFCRGVSAGRFPRLDDRDDLWQVLVLLTVRKAANQRKHATRRKRGGGMVQSESDFPLADGSVLGIDSIAGDEPTPEFAASVAEQVNRLLESLGDETLRHVALAKLDGRENPEIARQFEVSLRTIERKLAVIREIWANAESAPE
jgi:DNA-directed RNA polymerase specialized sigma24 family protein